MAVSDADIQAYVQANIGNPAAIAAAAQQYGVSLDDLTRATGYDTGTINNYFSQANVTPYYQQPQPQTYTPPEPPQAPVAPTVYAPPAPVERAPVYPEPVVNYSRGGGTVLEDTSFGSNVGNFGELDYFSQPQTKTQAEPPPAPVEIIPPRPIAPDIKSPLMYEPPAPPPKPQYSAPMAPTAPVAPTITPVVQPKSLVEQILGQGTTSKWTGEGFGSAEKNAADMARILGDIGITDISQFGKIVKEEPTYSYDEQGNQTFTGNQKIETFGNKLTGQTVGNTYGERQTGDAFGGTYTGKGNTGYRVQFDDKGNPYFYTSAQSSSDAGQWMPIVQLALAATGAGGLLGNALLGTGAGAVATNALGNAIISGALTGAQGGDVLKGALLGGAGGALGGYLQGGTPTAGGGSSIFGGAIDGSTVNFADLAETGVIDSLKAQGLSNAQIGQWLENASAADLGYVPPVDAIPGAGIDFNELADNALIDSLKAQGLSNQQISQFIENTGAGTGVAPVTPGIETVNVTGTANPAVTAPVVPTMVDPNILAAVTTQLNTNLKTPVPEIKITGDKVTKTDDTTTPTVTVTGDKVVKPVIPTVPTVEVVDTKVTKKDDTVPVVEVVADKPVKPVVPDVPVVEIVADKPVTPVVPTVEIVAPKPTCPSPEMLIHLADGSKKPAGELAVGDVVRTQHEHTMAWGDHPVTHTEIIPNAQRLKIKFEDTEIVCSYDHKFFDKVDSWVTAKDVKFRDILSGKVVKSVEQVEPGPVVMITIDDAHTYICQGLLSHNKSPLPPVVPPVVPEIVITPPPVPPVPPVVPPVVPPPVIVPPVVLPPVTPKPPVVVPPVVTTPPTTLSTGVGLNPGMMEPTPFYNTTNDAQSKYFWGGHGFQAGPTFNAQAYNAVAAPETPWGAQGVAAPMSAQDYEDIIAGRYTPEQFTPATRVQAYDPSLAQAPVNQLQAYTPPVAGPVTPTNYNMTSAEVQQVASVLGNDMAQRLAAAMAAGDMETVNNIKAQYEYALMSNQNQGGGGDGGGSGGGDGGGTGAGAGTGNAM